MAHYGYPLRSTRFTSHWMLTKGLFLSARWQIRLCDVVTSYVIARITTSRLPDRVLLNKFNFLGGFSEIWFWTQVSVMTMPHGLRSTRSTSLTHLLLLLLGLIMLVKLHLLLIKMQCDERRGIISWWVRSTVITVAACPPLNHIRRSQIWFMGRCTNRGSTDPICLIT
jgi:hypothetical protein